MTNPIATADQLAAERDVAAMLVDSRLQVAQTTVQQLFAMGYGARLPEEAVAEMAPAAREFVTNWAFKAVASDAQHPRFVRNFMPAYSWFGQDVPGARAGGDNPDNCYRLAGVAHGGRYRITGRIIDRKPASTSFTLTGNYGTSVTIQTIEDDQLEWARDGSFVITIDDEPANGRSNHLTTSPLVKFLFVRDSFMDWTTESPYQLTIERLGPANASPISVDQMIDEAAFRVREDVPLYFWFQSVLASRPPNTVTSPVINKTGGLVTQGISRGRFDLGDDDAAVVTLRPDGAAYSAIQLTEWLYRSADYERIQSSLTTAQSAIDDDGMVRWVIAKRDPGVANWIDTGGRQHVLSVIRWQGLPATAAQHGLFADARLTSIDRLQAELPASTVWVEAAERAASIGARRDAYARRIAS